MLRTVSSRSLGRFRKSNISTAPTGVFVRGVKASPEEKAPISSKCPSLMLVEQRRLQSSCSATGTHASAHAQDDATKSAKKFRGRARGPKKFRSDVENNHLHLHPSTGSDGGGLAANAKGDESEQGPFSGERMICGHVLDRQCRRRGRVMKRFTVNPSVGVFVLSCEGGGVGPEYGIGAALKSFCGSDIILPNIRPTLLPIETKAEEEIKDHGLSVKKTSGPPKLDEKRQQPLPTNDGSAANASIIAPNTISSWTTLQETIAYILGKKQQPAGRAPPSSLQSSASEDAEGSNCHATKSRDMPITGSSSSSSRVSSGFGDLEHLLTFESLQHSSRGDEGFEGCLPLSALSGEERRILDLLEMLLRLAANPSLVEPHANGREEKACRNEKGPLFSYFGAQPPPTYVDNRPAVFEALLQLASFTETQFIGKSLEGTTDDQEGSIRHCNIDSLKRGLFGGGLQRIKKFFFGKSEESDHRHGQTLPPTTDRRDSVHHRGPSTVRWFVHCRVLCSLASVAASLGQYLLASLVIKDAIRPLLDSVSPSANTTGGRETKREEDEDKEEDESTQFDLSSVISTEYDHALLANRFKMSLVHMFTLCAWCNVAEGNTELALLFFEEALGFAKLGLRASVERGDGDGFNGLPLQFTGGLHFPNKQTTQETSDVSLLLQDHHRVMVPLSYADVCLSYASFVYNGREYGEALEIVAPLVRWLRAKIENRCRTDETDELTDLARKDYIALQRALLLMGRCVRKGGDVAGSSSTRSFMQGSADEDPIAGLGLIQGLTPAEDALRLFEEAERIGSYLYADSHVPCTAERHHTSRGNDAQQEYRTLHTDGKNAEEAIRRLIALVSSAPQSLDAESALCVAVTDTLLHQVVVATNDRKDGGVSSTAVGNGSFSGIAAYEQALVYHYDYVIPTASATSKQPTVALGRRALACYDRATAGLRRHITETQKQLGLVRKLRDALVARAVAMNEAVGESDTPAGTSADVGAATERVSSLYQATITTTANVILSLEDTLKDLCFTYAQMLNDAAILHEGLAGAKVTSMCPNFGVQNAGGIYREALRALEAAGRADVSARVRLGYARSLLATHNLAEAQQQCSEALAIVLGARGGGGANEDESSFVSEPLIAAYAYRDSSVVADRHTTAPQLAGDRSLAYLSAGEVHAHIAFMYQYCVSADSDDGLTAVTVLAERHYLQALDYSGIDVDAITYEGVMRKSTKARAETMGAEVGRCLGKGTAADEGEDAPTAHVEPSTAKSRCVATHFSYAPISPIPMEESTIGWMLENFAMLLMNLPREFSLASKLLRTRIILAEHGGGSQSSSRSSPLDTKSSSPPMLYRCISAYTALAGCMEHLASHGMGLPDAIGVFRALLRVPAAHFDPLQKYELVRRYAAAAAQTGDYATAAELFAAAISLTNTCPELYIQYAQCLGRLTDNHADVEHIMQQYELALAAFEMHEAVRRRREALDSETNYQGHTCGLLGMSSSTLVRDLGLAEEETQLCSQHLGSVLVSGRTVNDDLVFGVEDKDRSPPLLPLEILQEPETLAEIFNSHPSRAVIRFDDHITRDTQTTHFYDPFYVYSETALFLQTVKMDYSAAEAVYKRLLKRYDSSRTSAENYSQTLINYALLKQQHTDDAIGARILFAAAVRVDPTRSEARLSFAEFLYTQQSYTECLQQVLAILDPSNELVKSDGGAQGGPSGGSTFVLHPPQGETEASVVSPREIMSQLTASAAASFSSSHDSSELRPSPSSGTASTPQKTQNLSTIFAAVSRALSASPRPPLIAGAGDGSAQQQGGGGGGNPPQAARLHSLIGALKSSIAPDDAVSVTESFLLAMGVDSASLALAAEKRAQREGEVREGGHPEPMIALLEALRAVPDPTVPLSYLAYLTGKTMHFGFARSCYAILCERFPSDPNVLISAAHFYGDVLKEKGTARRLYLKAMRLDPENVNTISSCAIFLMTAYPKRFEEIDGLFRLAMELAGEGLAKRDLEPGEDGVPISTAAAAAARKNRFEKEQLIKKKTEEEESSGTASETSSCCSGEAFEGVEGAASSHQEGPELMDLGVTLNYLSFLIDYRWSPVASYRLFQRALRCFPKSAQLHATYGAFLDRYAATVRKKSLLSPAGDIKASAAAAATHTSTNMKMLPAAGHAAIKALAKEHFLTAIRLSPNKAIPYLMYGSSLSRQRKYAESLSYLQHAARLEPSNETVLESCANVLFSWCSHLVSQQGAGAVGSEEGGNNTDNAASTASAFSPPSSTAGLIDHSTSPLLKDLFSSSNFLATDSSGGDESFPSYDPYSGIGHQLTGSLAEIRDAAVFYYRRLIAINPTSLHYLSSYARFITEGLQNEAVGKKLYDVVAAVEASRNRARRESQTMMLMESQQHEELMSITRSSGEKDDATEGSDKKTVKRGEPAETTADEGVVALRTSGRPSTIEEILAAVAAAEEAKRTAARGQAEQTEDLRSSSAAQTAQNSMSHYPSSSTLSSPSSALSDGLKGRPSTLEEILAAVAAAEAAKAKRLSSSEEAYKAEVTVVEEEEEGESQPDEDKAEEEEESDATTAEDESHKKGGAE